MLNIIPKLIIWIFLIIYFFHFTIIQAFLPDITNIYYLQIFILFILIFFRKNRVEKKLIPLLIMSFMSLLVSSDLLYGTYLRWISWVLLILVAGPILINHKNQKIRAYLWYGLMFIYVVITTLSFFWIILKLPSFGVDEELFLGDGKYFRNGVTLHEMILAPISAMSGIFLLHYLFNKRYSIKSSILIIILVIISIITLIMATSRISLAAFIFVTILMIYQNRIKIIGLVKGNTVKAIILSLTIIVLGLFYIGNIFDFIQNNSHYQTKGLNNSRESLWAARINDFMKNPIAGVGFHSVSKEVALMSGAGVNIKTGRVEFGSAYLQALSTMGLIGFLIFVLFLLKILVISIKKINEQNGKLYFYIFIFFLIHLVAEAYVFSAGSILCIFFWLTISQINSLRHQEV